MASSVFLGSLSTSLSEAGHQRFWYWRGWRIRYWFYPGPPEAADQPPLLLIHGFGANLNQWRSNLPALSQGGAVYALDLLGFGDAEKAPTGYGAELWAAQVAEFIETIMGPPILLVGHSLGALVALTVAHHHPDWIQQLLMVTLPLPAAREDLVAGWVGNLALKVESLVATPLLMRPLFSLVRRPFFLRWALRGIYINPARVDEELLHLFALPPQQRGAARTLCYLVRSRTNPNFSPSIKAMIQSLQIPTLLVWGQWDRVIPVSFSEALAQLSPHLSLRLLADSGHCLYDESPSRFNELVRAWIDQGLDPGHDLNQARSMKPV